jgi:hypothetical protein
MIKASSVPNQYYFEDFPGTLQYKKERKDLVGCLLQDNNDTCGYKLCEHSLENLRRITPYTQRGVDWSILLMMSKEVNDEIWLKAALLNKATGKIALLTSTNSKNNLEKNNSRAVKTIDGTWFVGHYRMSAPVIFWKELKNRLLY